MHVLTLIKLYMCGTECFASGVIITGGKWRSGINAMDVLRDRSISHVQLWLHVRASTAFSEGALRLIALGLVARSAGSLTFWDLKASTCTTIFISICKILEGI